jgi:hypothetical protein
MPRTFLATSVALLLIVPRAFAQEPIGCDKFKWPLDRERALLANAKPLASAGNAAAANDAAVKLALVPFGAAKLPAPPSRAPKAKNSMAGFVTLPAPAKAGTYRVTLSASAWIDVVQAGKEVKSTAFSGATGCEGVRKSVKFELAAKPFVIELSGTAAPEVALVVTTD